MGCWLRDGHPFQVNGCGGRTSVHGRFGVAWLNGAVQTWLVGDLKWAMDCGQLMMGSVGWHIWLPEVSNGFSSPGTEWDGRP
jgi:hypothetical protein